MSDISFFDQKTLSYTYENGWSFTNFFDGDTRITKVAKRGVLREKVVVQQVRDGVWFVAWEDEHMGPISQTFDFNANRMWAAVKFEGELQIWPGEITGFGEGRPEGLE